MKKEHTPEIVTQGPSSQEDKLSGIQHKQAQWKAGLEKIEQDVKSDPPFSGEFKDVFTQYIESTTKKYLKQKLYDLGLDSGHIDNILPTLYKSEHRNVSSGGIYYVAYGHPIAIINRSTNELSSFALSAAHEIVHASTRNQKIWLYFSDSIENPDVYQQVGLERVSNKSRLVSAFENGLTIMDEVDLYSRYFRHIVGDEYESRLELAHILAQDEQFKKDNHLYLPIDPSLLLTSVYTYCSWNNEGKKKPRDRDVGLIQYDSNSLHQLILTRRICRLIGRYVDRDDKDEQRQIDVGREILDLDRYTQGSNRGLRIIVEMFGGQQARILFKATDRGEGVDEAMKVILNKESDYEKR